MKYTKCRKKCQRISIIYYILGIITVIQLIQEAIKSLEEKIAAKEAEITRLDKLADWWFDEYKRRRAVMKQREREVNSARRAYNAAVTAYNSAVTAEKAAGRSYRTAAHYAQMAQRDYMNHVQWCSTCRGSMLCPIGQNLHAAWQSWEKAKKDAKVAWDNAKAQVKSARSAKKAAKETLDIALFNLGSARMLANAALAQARALNKAVDKLRAELKPLMVKKAIKDAELAKAMGDLAEAKRKLDEAERDYPDQWRESMKDPNFRQDVDRIRNF